MPKERERPSLLDLCRDPGLAPVKSRATWLDGLDDDIRSDAMEAKKQWLAGNPALSPNRMALRIVAALQVLGVAKLPSRTSVAEWLRS